MNILQQRIQEASQKYYTDGSSDISDAEFDNMLNQLKKEDPDSPLIKAVGHGYAIEQDTTPGQRLPHIYGTVGSLVKCHNYKEVDNMLKVASIFASLKLDGMSVVLYYEKGHLVGALTRGNGIFGIDITEKVKRIDSSLEYLKEDREFTGAVRGEILMAFANFDMFHNIHPEAKNARSSTVGLINGQSITSDYDLLDIIVYTVVGFEYWHCSHTYGCMRHWLTANFDHVVPASKLNTLNEQTFLQDMEGLQHFWYGTYPADGIVLTDDELAVVNHTDSNKIEVIYQANAFKFKAESAITKVIGLEWNLSKTKYLIPRINFETVQLSGTSVSWCAGNNAKYIMDNNIGVGAEVEVLKSGEIIPYLEKVHQGVPYDCPSECPCCGTKLVMSGVHLMCPNRECGDAHIQDTLVWMENIAPWDGLGDTLKLTYLAEMFGDDVSIEKIYEYGEFNELAIETPLIKKTEFRKMFNALFTNKVKLCDAIQALNIPRLGDVTSRKLAKHPEIVKYLIKASINFDEDIADYANILGEANFRSILSNIHKFKRLQFIYDNIIWEEQQVEKKGKVAITGKLSVKRSQFEEELRQAGYVPANISKDTAFLITDDPNSSSEKNKKADAWGITKITESDFRKQYL